MDIKVRRNEVNLEAMDANLREALGERFFGVSFDGQQVILHLDDGVSQAQVISAVQMAEAHDPEVLTPVQEAAKARASQLAQMRQSNQSALDLTTYGESAPEIRRLAEKIAWLETEIAELR